MKLRRPTEMLAGCCWLPRFIDKVRHQIAGTLDPDFVFAFCHPQATDGQFFAHFHLTKEEILPVIQGASDDQVVAEWFAKRPECSPAKIAEWNALAPNLGKPGQPMERAFHWAIKKYYGGNTPDPRIISVFTALAWDEGYIDEL